MCLTVIAALALFAAPATSQAPTPERDFNWVGPSFVAVRVADVEAAATWYREVFDLAQVNQIDADDGAYNIRLLSGEGLNVELLQQRGAQLAPERPLGLFKMGLFVTDLDAFMRHLSNQGVDHDAESFTDEALNVRTFVFRDLEGNLLQAFEELSHRPGTLGAGISHLGVGPVLLSLNEDELRQAVGASRFEDAEFYVAEGFCSAGSIAFPGTPNQISILWSDDSPRRIGGIEVDLERSTWRTAGGLGIGSTLADMVRVGGVPVTFNGFEWDYGGWTTWTEGPMTVGIRLQPDWDQDQNWSDHPRIGEVLGDQDVPSDHPLVQEMTIRINQIFMPGPAEGGAQFECTGG